MKKSQLKLPAADGSAIVVKSSPIHGRGVFAKKNIQKGSPIIEYRGERIDWKEAERRHPHDPRQPNHTFYFSLDDGRVIDANHKGNAARWINHSCKPNCEAQEEIYDGESRVFIFAKRAILPGEELFYDYALELEGRITKAIKKDYACHCGANQCRGTMLAKQAK